MSAPTPNAADILEAAYEAFSGKFAVRFPLVETDTHFMVPEDAAHAFTEAMEQGIAAFRAALTAPAPAEAELRAEVERLEGLLRLAGPALRAAQTYHYKRAHAAHALPGSRDRAGYEIEANDALFRLRLDSAQKGAAAVLEALKPEDTP